MAFKVLCVDHVGIAVSDLEGKKKMMKEVLGLDPTMADETVEDQHVTTSFFKPSAQTEACELEFLGSTTEDGPIARFIDKNGAHDGYPRRRHHRSSDRTPGKGRSTDRQTLARRCRRLPHCFPAPESNRRSHRTDRTSGRPVLLIRSFSR